MLNLTNQFQKEAQVLGLNKDSIEDVKTYVKAQDQGEKKTAGTWAVPNTVAKALKLEDIVLKLERGAIISGML